MLVRWTMLLLEDIEQNASGTIIWSDRLKFHTDANKLCRFLFLFLSHFVAAAIVLRPKLKCVFNLFSRAYSLHTFLGFANSTAPHIHIFIHMHGHTLFRSLYIRVENSQTVKETETRQQFLAHSLAFHRLYIRMHQVAAINFTCVR